MKKIQILGALAVALVAFVFISNIVTIDKKTASETIKIGLAVGLTGYASNWGDGEVKAVELALDEWQSKLPVAVELIIEDTKSDGTGTVNAVKKLVEIDHVQALIGPTWGDSFQGGYPIAERARVAIASPSAALESIGDTNPFTYLFSTWWPQQDEVVTLVDHMKKAEVKTVYIIHDQDAFNSKFADIFIAASGDNFTIVRSAVPIGSNDFRTEVAKMRSENSDAVLAMFQDTGSVGPLMKQLREQGSKAVVYSTTSAQNEENLQKFPGLFNGLIYSFPSYAEDEQYRALQEKLKEKYGKDAPEGPAFVNAYNAATALFAVLESGATTGEEIRDGLRKVHVSGIGTDDLYFNDNGQIDEVDFIIKTIQNDTFVEVGAD